MNGARKLMLKKEKNMSHKFTQEKIGRGRARLRNRIFREIRRVFRKAYKESGLTQKEIAERLGADPALVSKRLNGDANLTLNTIADLFTAIEARLEMNGVLYSEIEPKISHSETRILRYGLEEPYASISPFNETLIHALTKPTGMHKELNEWYGEEAFTYESQKREIIPPPCDQRELVVQAKQKTQQIKMTTH